MSTVTDTLSKSSSYPSFQPNHLKMLTIIVFLLTFSSITSTGETTIRSTCDKVDWTVLSKPELTGKDVKLICKTTDEKELCSECDKLWTGGPELSLLSLNGFPTDDSKYLPTIGKNEFEITIKHFNKIDLNQEYICSIGKNSCCKNLTIDMVDILEENKSEVDAFSGLNKKRTTLSTEVIIIIVIAVMVVLGIIIIVQTKENRKHKDTLGYRNDYQPTQNDPSIMEHSGSGTWKTV